MRHAVLGAGGVGGLVGGALAKAGHPVTLLVRPGRRNLYPERLSVQSEPFGNFEAPVRVADRLDEQFDVVWIAVKATALESALSSIPPEVLEDGVLVPLLNGVDHVRRLRDRYGAERILPGTIRVEAEQAEPGRVRHLSAFADVQVAPNPATRIRAETLCNVVGAVSGAVFFVGREEQAEPTTGRGVAGHARGRYQHRRDGAFHVRGAKPIQPVSLNASPEGIHAPGGVGDGLGVKVSREYEVPSSGSEVQGDEQIGPRLVAGDDPGSGKLQLREQVSHECRCGTLVAGRIGT